MFQFLTLSHYRTTPLTASLLFAVVSQFISERTTYADQPERPNIVFILADDMGYGDVQTLNPQSQIPTPNLNRLAEQGMTFIDAHTPSSVCTPTRYGVLNGRYCWRTRLKSGVLNGYGTSLIDSDRTTVAEMLRQQGYATGVVGKWHLGLGFAKDDSGKVFDFSKPVDNGPHTHGFDESFVIPASLDFPPYVYINNGTITEFPKLEQPASSFPKFLRKGERSPDFVMAEVLDKLASEASRFISNHAKQDEPFFLYFPLTAPHKPVWPHPRFEGQTELGPYGDFVAQVDATVGQVIKTIDDAGITESTLVIYTSDNGSFMHRYGPDKKDHVEDESIQGYRAEHHTANGPLRGTKADIWEAGHRVPFFVRWPGKVAPHSRCDKTICLTDFFATAAALSGGSLSGDTAPDSFSLLPLLTGEDWATPRPPVIHHSAAGMFAIREGNWKLVMGNGSGGREQPKGKPFQKPYALFNLKTDIEEAHNLIEAHPDIAQRLERACEQIRKSGRSRIK